MKGTRRSWNVCQQEVKVKWNRRCGSIWRGSRRCRTWTRNGWTALEVRSCGPLKRGGEEEAWRDCKIAEMEHGKKVRFVKEEPPEEMQAQSTDEQDVMRGLEEVKTGRGSAGLM